MGLYRRLFKGASQRDESALRSPEEARVFSELAEEIRALQTEIRKLRDTLDTGQDGSKRERGRRGGRNRPSRDENRSSGGSFSARGRKDGAPKTPPEDAPVGLLVDYLKKHKVLVFEGQDDVGQNEAFEHLARHMGQHFDLLGPFYEKMKRAVATGRTTRVDIDNYSEQERSAAVQLGTLLYRHGMLKDFYYHRSPKRQLRVIPNKDGEIQQFLTGGWLEIYVVWLLSRRLRARMSAAKYQVLYNVKGTLPNGAEFESDLMACIDGKLLWIECKTGQWQDYSARFRGLVKTFGTDREGAGLALIKPPDGNTRQRATDMLDMTLLSLSEVEGFVDDFLGVPADERMQLSGRRSVDGDKDSTAPLPVGMIPPRSEDEIPLEDAEPAKKLGRVSLDRRAEAAAGEEVPRRRRRRRRGRGGGSAADDNKDSRQLKEPLPVAPIDGESDEAGDDRSRDGSNESGEGGEGEDRRRRRRRGSRGGRRRRRPDEAGEGNESDEFDSADESASDSRGEDAGEEGRDKRADSRESEREDDGEKRPRRRRSRSRSNDAAAAKDESAERSQAVEEAEESEEAAEAEAKAVTPEPKPEPKPEAPAMAIPEGMMVKTSSKKKPAAKPKRAVAKPMAAKVPRSKQGSAVIAPDLAAMMAGGAAKPKQNAAAEAPAEDESDGEE